MCVSLERKGREAWERSKRASLEIRYVTNVDAAEVDEQK